VPRIHFGAISDWYRGTSTDMVPTPTPAKNLHGCQLVETIILLMRSIPSSEKQRYSRRNDLQYDAEGEDAHGKDQRETSANLICKGSRSQSPKKGSCAKNRDYLTRLRRRYAWTTINCITGRECLRETVHRYDAANGTVHSDVSITLLCATILIVSRTLYRIQRVSHRMRRTSRS
jgi:hypothetical protein